MAELGFVLFETAIGACGLVWGERGLVGVQLPEAKQSATRTRVLERFPSALESAPPPAVRKARDAMVSLLSGRPRDLSAVALDLQRVPAFHRKVYALARAIGPGQTLSYGELAAKLGSPGAARAVGQAMRRNPFPIVVPCHRVLAAGGKVGGFTANGGTSTKLRMLAIEGAAPGRATAKRSRLGEPAAATGEFDFEPSAAIRNLKRADPELGRLMGQIGPFRMQLRSTTSLFAALAEAIVYQQLTGKAAATIFARVCALCPRGKLGAKEVLALSDDALRGAGLSRSKLASLRDLSRRVAARELPTLRELAALDDEAVIERLTEVRGVGRWTAEMILIFRLGRRDVLPLDDYGVKKGFAKAFGLGELPKRSELEQRGERWKPFRSVASWFLWRASELPRE